MKYFYFFLISCTILIQSCNGQTKTPQRVIYNKDFKWSITIPENFENVSAEQWAKMQNRGADAIEKTYDTKIENHAKTIFVFKSDQFNYFESNYQPFDLTKDGDYIESCRGVNEMLYQTFKTQMPGVKIDTTVSIETIDKLEFRKFKMNVTYPNKMILYVLMYSRLFDNREFSVNIMFMDRIKGGLMINAWKNSKFGNE